MSSVSASTDTSQVQMMQLLTDTFSKLSTVLQESKNVSKSEWPKFSGEASKFKDWYLAIMAQLSLPPWSSLYDNVSMDRHFFVIHFEGMEEFRYAYRPVREVKRCIRIEMLCFNTRLRP